MATKINYNNCNDKKYTKWYSLSDYFNSKLFFEYNDLSMNSNCLTQPLQWPTK